MVRSGGSCLSFSAIRRQRTYRSALAIVEWRHNAGQSSLRRVAANDTDRSDRFGTTSDLIRWSPTPARENAL